MKVLLDTCVLISLISEEAGYHEVAQQYFKDLIEKRHRVMISPLTLAEYGVKGCLSDVYKLPIGIPLFGTPHAEKAAEFCKVTGNKDKVGRSIPNERRCIAIDTMILAQASVEQVALILTLDHRTFARTAHALVDAGYRIPKIILLDDKTEPQ